MNRNRVPQRNPEGTTAALTPLQLPDPRAPVYLRFSSLRRVSGTTRPKTFFWYPTGRGPGPTRSRSKTVSTELSPWTADPGRDAPSRGGGGTLGAPTQRGPDRDTGGVSSLVLYNARLLTRLRLPETGRPEVDTGIVMGQVGPVIGSRSRPPFSHPTSGE